MIPQVKNQVFWVVGLARSGCAAGALLRRHGAQVIGIDDAAEEAVTSRWEREGLTNLAPEAFHELATGGDWPSVAPSGIIISPGVPLTHPHLAAWSGKVPIWAEMELGARFCTADLVAITGTNGKSTTTEMIAHLARKAGRRAEALGNLGTPLSQVADQLPPEAVVALEVSSFQLEAVHEFHPRVGLVLNLAPDHLDRYENLAAYYAAKRVLADQMTAEGTFITWTGCPEARGWTTAARRLLFGDDQPEASAFYREGELRIRRDGADRFLIRQNELALHSPPNLLNALAAVTAGLALDLDPESLAEGLKDFPGLAHRHQLTARKGDIQFINDTKATNVHAVCAGLQGYPQPVVLIAGGSGKGEDYTPLREVMQAVRGVVLIGQEGPAIGQVLEGVVPCVEAASMEEAVAMACRLAEPDARVLLSPACASFDMFASYRQRGEEFTRAAVTCGAQIVAAKEETGKGSNS
jgi:UDP-N-acetylmuramoylalanine--D-glutamate ligase|nr:UDP-N-acetylmuramoyl-L-alanine--D-glutamate ligase [Candidatus Krumholzibacteria bacterium]